MKKRMFFGAGKFVIALTVALGSYGVGAAYSSNIMAISSVTNCEVAESGSVSLWSRRGRTDPVQATGVVRTEALTSALQSMSLPGMPGLGL